MNNAPTGRAPSTGRWGIDRGLALLVVGALILVIAGLVAIPLAARRAPALAPETTPEGVVQRFYQALYRDDYAAAYSFLSPETQRGLSLTRLQQELEYQIRDSQARTGAVTVNDGQATVEVSITRFGSGGLFGSSEWTSDQEVLLERAGTSWKIVSGFGAYVEPLPSATPARP